MPQAISQVYYIITAKYEARGYPGLRPTYVSWYLTLRILMPGATPEAMYLDAPGYAWGYVPCCPGRFSS